MLVCVHACVCVCVCVLEKPTGVGTLPLPFLECILVSNLLVFEKLDTLYVEVYESW